MELFDACRKELTQADGIEAQANIGLWQKNAILMENGFGYVRQYLTCSRT